MKASQLGYGNIIVKVQYIESIVSNHAIQSKQTKISLNYFLGSSTLFDFSFAVDYQSAVIEKAIPFAMASLMVFVKVLTYWLMSGRPVAQPWGLPPDRMPAR